MTSDFKSDFLGHLQKLVFFLEFREANPFKIRAFKNAEETLETVSNSDLVEGVKSGLLTDIKGIGKGILSVAQGVLKTGTSDELNEARGDLPETLLELRLIKGLGPKKIKALYEQLQIASLGELEYACNENRLSSLKGFGERAQQSIQNEIAAFKKNQGKVLLSDALSFEAQILSDPAFKKVSIQAVGALGERREIIESLDFLAASQEKNIKISATLPLPVHISSCDPKNFIWERIQRTSSQVFLKSLLDTAAKKKIDLSKMTAKTEEEFFSALGLPHFPSEAREFSANMAKAWTPLTSRDLTGVFHLHTTESDGLHTLEEMALAAHQRGWSFIGLSDHSKTAVYAGGLDERKLAAQWTEIAKIEKKLSGLRILKGIESDILKDGSLDYPTSTLKKFDFVIASIHMRYGMKEMTDRLIKAIENPFTSMIGHISGRLLLAREPYAFDVDKVVDAAIANKRVIELNAHPQRLDMDWRFLRKACEKGLIISINPDAHSVSGYDDIQFGIMMANKALVPKEQVLNTWPLEKILRFLKDQRL